MAVFRVEKNANYTTMCNYHLRDKNLSMKAKGLLSHVRHHLNLELALDCCTYRSLTHPLAHQRTPEGSVLQWDELEFVPVGGHIHERRVELHERTN